MKKRYEFLVPSTSYNAYGTLNECLRKEYYEGERQRPLKDIKEGLDKGGICFCWNLSRAEETNFSGEGLFEAYADQVIGFITKHPAQISKELKHFPKQSRILVSDKSYGEFLKKYYNRDSQFLPIPGIQSRKRVSWNKRVNKVFFPGSYLDPLTIKKQIEENIADELQPLIWEIIRLLQNEPMRTLADVTVEGLHKYDLKDSDELIRSFLEEYGFYIEEYVNRFHRKRLITYLLKKQIPIVVTGVHWDVFAGELNTEEKDCLTILSKNIPLDAVTDFMASVKVVINTATGCKDGINERVAIALQNGATCFTERNPYTEALAESHPNLKLYNYKALNKLSKELEKELKREEPYPQVTDESLGMSALVKEILK